MNSQISDDRMRSLEKILIDGIGDLYNKLPLRDARNPEELLSMLEIPVKTTAGILREALHFEEDLVAKFETMARAMLRDQARKAFPGYFQ